MAIGGEKLNYPAPQHTQGLPRARHPKKGVRVGLHVNTAVRKPLPHIRALKPEIPLHMSKHHLNPALGNFQRLRQNALRPWLKRHLKQQQPA